MDNEMKESKDELKKKPLNDEDIIELLQSIRYVWEKGAVVCPKCRVAVLLPQTPSLRGLLCDRCGEVFVSPLAFVKIQVKDIIRTIEGVQEEKEHDE